MSGSDNNFLVWFGGSKEAKNASRTIDLTSKELPCTLFFLNTYVVLKHKGAGTL